jgi:hypothetical protein
VNIISSRGQTTRGGPQVTHELKVNMSMGLIKHHTVKTYGETEVAMSGQLHAPTSLTAQRSLRCQMDMRLGGPRSRSGRCEEDTTSVASARNRTPSPRSFSPKPGHCID